ncbi:late competence protein ComEA [Halalkalibacter wakoensis JCM 9140]|uniref:Late competence protein ComEA n=1 Tax=Halalkalibacter wakoensis JCM 9140 TaxID=1236970 RepID=W4Q5V6_9BACI|nr:helix-hairpin-helix domain-containing protein [Halalkalibacter wakoensis]GAE27083.1 late competence protein ComEA [Halalkalibacter wakoensis JCM 9140]
MKKIAEMKQIIFLITIVLLVSLVLFLHFRNDKNDVALNLSSYEGNFETMDLTEDSVVSDKLVVDVKGAVKRPGVYELEQGKRMHDLITMAGGYLDEAEELKLNLAQLLHDEMMIYVPFKGEEPLEHMPIEGSESTNGTININRAEATTLEQLPGIGPAKAQAIVAYREENGPFKTVEDLLQVSGIGPKSIEKLREQVAFH